MSMRRFFIFFLLIPVLTFFIPNASAQNYTRWGLPEGAIMRLGKGSIKELQFSPDGTRLAVTTSIGIWLYDVQTGKEIDVLAAHTGSIRKMSFSPDSEMLASGGTDSAVQLWSVETGNPLKPLKGYTNEVLSVSFSANGKILISGGLDGTILLWDTSLFK